MCLWPGLLSNLLKGKLKDYALIPLSILFLTFHFFKIKAILHLGLVYKSISTQVRPSVTGSFFGILLNIRIVWPFSRYGDY